MSIFSLPAGIGACWHLWHVDQQMEYIPDTVISQQKEHDFPTEVMNLFSKHVMKLSEAFWTSQKERIVFQIINV